MICRCRTHGGVQPLVNEQQCIDSTNTVGEHVGWSKWASMASRYVGGLGCASTTFGCCPDGQTVATEWNYRSCPGRMMTLPASYLHDRAQRMHQPRCFFPPAHSLVTWWFDCLVRTVHSVGLIGVILEMTRWSRLSTFGGGRTPHFLMQPAKKNLVVWNIMCTFSLRHGLKLWSQFWGPIGSALCKPKVTLRGL